MAYEGREKVTVWKKPTRSLRNLGGPRRWLNWDAGTFKGTTTVRQGADKTKLIKSFCKSIRAEIHRGNLSMTAPWNSPDIHFSSGIVPVPPTHAKRKQFQQQFSRHWCQILVTEKDQSASVRSHTSKDMKDIMQTFFFLVRRMKSFPWIQALSWEIGKDGGRYH
jgi:hypothetical protein